MVPFSVTQSRSLSSLNLSFYLSKMGVIPPKFRDHQREEEPGEVGKRMRDADSRHDTTIALTHTPDLH